MLSSLRDYLDSELLSEAATKYIETEAGISKAMNSLVATLLAGVLEKCGDTHTLDIVYHQVRQFDPSVLNQLKKITVEGIPFELGLESSVTTFLQTVLGSKAPAIVNALASFSGTKPSTVQALMIPGACLVTGLLSKKIREEEVPALGLARYLVHQRNSIHSLLPAGVAGLLGISGNASGYQETSGQRPAWFMVLILVLLLGLALLYFLRPT